MYEIDEEGRRNLLIGAVVLAFIILALASQSQNNQLVRPVPGGAPAPIVPQLPDMMAELRSMKSLCEGRAAASIDLVRGQGGGEVHLSEGRRLYVEAQSALDGCITYIVAGLSRRFVPEDAPAIAGRLAAGRARADAFVAWANALQRTTAYGDTGPLDLVAQMVADWMRRANEQDAQAREQLRADLEACRLRDWNELGR